MAYLQIILILQLPTSQFWLLKKSTLPAVISLIYFTNRFIPTWNHGGCNTPKHNWYSLCTLDLWKKHYQSYVLLSVKSLLCPSFIQDSAYFLFLVKEEKCSRVELYSSKTLNNALNSVQKQTELVLYESERKNLSLSLRHVVLLYHSTIY